MKKEVIICVVVIMLIVILNILTENNTEKVMNTITEYLEVTKEAIIDGEDEKMNENIDKAKSNWDKEKDVLSIYIEHDELEKIEMYLVEVETDIMTKEYNMAMESLNDCIFIINHIKDKYKLSLKNIF